MELRPYQRAAINALYAYLRDHDDNPVIVAPTGAGKAVVIAQIARDAVLEWNSRVLVLAHVRELLEQNADKVRRMCPELRVGLYSAGLSRRDTDTPVVVAGIQSIYKRAHDFGPVDLFIIDECHLLQPDGEGMYRQFLADAKQVNPHLRVVGLTATPFRTRSGLICSPDHFLNAVCYEISLKELIRDGYLCPLVSKAGGVKVNTDQCQVRAGEFIAGEVEVLMDQEEVVKTACAEIVELSRDRNACLVFSAGVKHGQHVCRILQEQHGVESAFVCGDTPAPEREAILARFRSLPNQSLFAERPLKYLVNCQLLTVGFDAPHIDAIAILRATMSPGLLVQMAGRGCRLHHSKRNCLLLDYGNNILRHGPIDTITAPRRTTPGPGQAPAKECPQCHSLLATGYARCPDCGYEFAPPDRKRHEAQASTVGILSGQITETEFEVRDITYTVHTKRGAPDDAPKTVRVDYRLGLSYWVSEFICFEHTGWARRNAERWWKVRSPDPVPETAEHAVDIANAGGVAQVDSVTVRSVAGEKYDRIIGYKLGPLPEPVPAGAAVNQDGDIPF